MTFKVVTIVGNRPQFVKVAAVSKYFKERGNIQEFLINTGQHYDPNLSDIFFQELGIDPPYVNLDIRSGPILDQIGKMLAPLKTAIEKIAPDLILVYGDTNSTLAGALVGAHMGIPVAHVEGGERLYRRVNVPEEVNRIVTDSLAALILTSTHKAGDFLLREGVNPKRIQFVGDPMFDIFQNNREIAERQAGHILSKQGVQSGEFRLATIHRVENTADTGVMLGLFEAMDRSEKEVILPLHPRVENILKNLDWKPKGNLRLVEAVGYSEFLSLLLNADMVVTDSGGVTRESFFAGVRCVTPLGGCWWSEAVDSGWNVVTAQDPVALETAMANFPIPETHDTSEFGDGNSGIAIEKAICDWLANANSHNKEGAWHPIGTFYDLPPSRNTPFSYTHYHHLAGGLRRAGYTFASFDDVDGLLDNRPFVLMRHDIDYDLEAALRLAELEAEIGVAATYFFMVRTEHYNLFSARGDAIVRRISNLGHHIGVHVDCVAYPSLGTIEDITKIVQQEGKMIANWFDVPVKTVSFHRPHPSLVDAPQKFFGDVRNAYHTSLVNGIAKYYSDSRGEWGHGYPLDSDAFKSGKPLQILTHPIWWRQACTAPFETMMRWLSDKDLRLKASVADNNSIFRVGVFKDTGNT